MEFTSCGTLLFSLAFLPQFLPLSLRGTALFMHHLYGSLIGQGFIKSAPVFWVNCFFLVIGSLKAVESFVALRIRVGHGSEALNGNQEAFHRRGREVISESYSATYLSSLIGLYVRMVDAYREEGNIRVPGCYLVTAH